MAMRLGRIVVTIAAVSGGLGGVAARAETLPVLGIYAAGTDAPSRAKSIAIAHFSGRGGERLAFAIDSALRAAIIEGRPYFDLTFTPPAFGDSYTYDGSPERPAAQSGPDAVMRGIAEVEWRDVDSGAKEVEECVAKDSADKCLEKKKVSYPCRAREVTFRPEVRLFAREGDLLYAKGDTLMAISRFCKDEEGSPSVDSMVEEMALGFADEIRLDLAPLHRVDDIRVLESRDGMSKADQAAFRAALRLTKTDVAGACRAFEALEATNPQNVTILFNAGLCREGGGQLDLAGRSYYEVLAIKPGKPEAQEGLARIASRVRAERQLFIHYGESDR
ncbi:MAG: hypothetical protein O9293_07020 [Porphyrobacter sp.]|nr:hypothetical protein [Porphyrobacter sp.]